MKGIDPSTVHDNRFTIYYALLRPTDHFKEDIIFDPTHPPFENTPLLPFENPTYAREFNFFVIDGENRPPRSTYIPPPPPEGEEEIFQTIQMGINFSKYDEIPVECTGNNAPKSGIQR